MTSFEEVAPAKRRRLIAAGLLRALSATVLLVVAYYLLPVRNLSDARSAVELVVGMLAVVLLLVWEARAILKAAYPGVKAVEALATIVPLFLLLFASAYYLIERATPEQFRPTPVAHRCLVLHRDHLLYCWLRRYHRQERRGPRGGHLPDACRSDHPGVRPEGDLRRGADGTTAPTRWVSRRQFGPGRYRLRRAGPA